MTTYVGCVPEEGEEEDDADLVECKFERVGDTNGVFYYLGMQRCAEPTDDVITHALEWPAPPPGVGSHQERRRFPNPAATGRVEIKTGPQRVMCCSKFKGRLASPEQVLERNVVGDQFWFPDGWVAIDLGLHTILKVRHVRIITLPPHPSPNRSSFSTRWVRACLGAVLCKRNRVDIQNPQSCYVEKSTY